MPLGWVTHPGVDPPPVRRTAIQGRQQCRLVLQGGCPHRWSYIAAAWRMVSCRCFVSYSRVVLLIPGRRILFHRNRSLMAVTWVVTWTATWTTAVLVHCLPRMSVTAVAVGESRLLRVKLLPGALQVGS